MNHRESHYLCFASPSLGPDLPSSSDTRLSSEAVNHIRVNFRQVPGSEFLQSLDSCLFLGALGRASRRTSCDRIHKATSYAADTATDAANEASRSLLPLLRLERLFVAYETLAHGLSSAARVAITSAQISINLITHLLLKVWRLAKGKHGRHVAVPRLLQWHLLVEWILEGTTALTIDVTGGVIITRDVLWVGKRCN